MKIRQRSPSARFLSVTLLVALACGGCGSKINEKNFERIQDGMPREDVEAILGAPTDTKSVGFGGFSGSHSTWKAKDGTTITIQFVNGKVVSKQLFKSSEEGRQE